MIGKQCDECDSFTFDKVMYDEWIDVWHNGLKQFESLDFCCMDCCGKYMIRNSHPTEEV